MSTDERGEKSRAKTCFSTCEQTNFMWFHQHGHPHDCSTIITFSHGLKFNGDLSSTAECVCSQQSTRKAIAVHISTLCVKRIIITAIIDFPFTFLAWRITTLQRWFAWITTSWHVISRKRIGRCSAGGCAQSRAEVARMQSNVYIWCSIVSRPGPHWRNCAISL